MPLTTEQWEEWTLYCACDRPTVRSHWRSRELKLYDVCNAAHHRGYGTPDEIVLIGNSVSQSRWKQSLR
jgi:hypothetical protein